MTEERRAGFSSPQESKEADQVVTLQSFYFNGFVLGLSNSDVNATLLVDGQPVLRLNMSYTTSKTLLDRLRRMMDKLEEITNNKIMLTEEVEAGLQKISKGEPQ